MPVAPVGGEVAVVVTVPEASVVGVSGMPTLGGDDCAQATVARRNDKTTPTTRTAMTRGKDPGLCFLPCLMAPRISLLSFLRRGAMTRSVVTRDRPSRIWIARSTPSADSAHAGSLTEGKCASSTFVLLGAAGLSAPYYYGA